MRSYKLASGSGGSGTNADFATAFAERENFAGIQCGLRIESIMHAAHKIEIGVREEQRHEFVFLHADTVFTSERAANFHAVANNFGGDLDGAFELSGIARVVEHDGMKVAITGVKNVADLKARALADFLDAAQGLREFRARNDTVEDVVGGRQTAECAKGILAGFPEEVAFMIVASHANFAGVMSAADFFDSCSLWFNCFV